MAYATYAEFIIKYDPKGPGLKVDDSGNSELIKPKTEQFLDDASSFIDTFLNARYTVPVTPVPNALRRANMIIARHDIDARRTGKANDEQHVEYEEIVEWLKAIRDGQADLPGVTVKSASAGIIESNDSVFDPDNFASY